MRSGRTMLAILGLLGAGLGLLWWQQDAPTRPKHHETNAPQLTTGKAPACEACVAGEETPVPAPGLLQVIHELPEFTFQDQDGKPFGLADLKGQVWVADFIYTRCAGPCPAMTVSMKTLQDRMEDVPGLHLVSFSVDPHDSVADLKQYAQNTGADARRWTFLKGAPEELKQLVVEGFYLGDKNDPITHSTRFVLVDQTGRIRGYYDHHRGDEMLRLKKHIHLLLTGERL